MDDCLLAFAVWFGWDLCRIFVMAFYYVDSGMCILMIMEDWLCCAI